MRKQQAKTRTLLGIIIAIVCIALFGAGIYALDRNVNERSTGAAVEPEEEAETVLYIDGKELEVTHNLETYLLIGTDDSGNEEAEGTEEYRGAMADFLLLLVMDKTDDAYGFLQIDRNTITEVPYMDTEGNGDDTIEEQICTAHWYGGTPQQGCDNTVDTVSELLGELPIDGYYSLHMSQMGLLNHAVGGVQVTLEEDFSAADPDMVKGKTLTLTDEQAEIYVRGRMEIGDGTNESRMDRQMQFMEGFKAKAFARLGEDSGFLNDLFTQLSDDAVTDIPGNRISAIINQMYKGEDRGILRPEGKTVEGTTLKDGKVHEEFYPEGSSIIECISTLCGIGEEDIHEESEEEE